LKNEDLILSTQMMDDNPGLKEALKKRPILDCRFGGERSGWIKRL